MFKKLLFLVGLFFLTASPVAAQNTTCATRAPGDSSNACASTAFVQSAVPSALVINIMSSPYNAKCDGTTDDSAAINTALIAAATTTKGGYVIIPSGYTCGFASTINLQEETTLKLMPNATLKFLGTGGDEILGIGGSTLLDRMNIEGPGTIDASNSTTVGNVIHYEGGSNDLVENISVIGNSSLLTVMQLNGNTQTGGVGNWRLSRVDGLFVTGTVGYVITLRGAGNIGNPTNNSFYNISASNGTTVIDYCIYAPRDNDTEFFYNINCDVQNGGSSIVIGAATGVSQTITSGTYNNTTGLVSLTLTSLPQEMEIGDTITLGSLTGTGSYASLEGTTFQVNTINGHVVTFFTSSGLGASTITGGSLAVTDTDAWGYHFDSYITAGGNSSIVLYETHDDSFIGGNDAQGSTTPGITNFSGPGIGPLSVQSRYVACHMVSNYNSNYMCASNLSYTVALLPAASGSSIDINARVYVTDATSCTYMTAPTGGGSTFCPVVWNGSAWLAD